MNNIFSKTLEILENMVDNHKSGPQFNYLKFDMREKFRQGKFLGGTLPFGYKIYQNNIRIESYTANIVRIIFEAYVRCSSTNEIAKGLNYLKIPTPLDFNEARKEGINEYKVQKSREWSSSTIYRILKNTTYMGLIAYGRQTRVQGGKRKNCSNKVEFYNENYAIISKEIFEKVQNRLNKREV